MNFKERQARNAAAAKAWKLVQKAEREKEVAERNYHSVYACYIDGCLGRKEFVYDEPKEN